MTWRAIWLYAAHELGGVDHTTCVPHQPLIHKQRNYHDNVWTTGGISAKPPNLNSVKDTGPRHDLVYPIHPNGVEHTTDTGAGGRCTERMLLLHYSGWTSKPYPLEGMSVLAHRLEVSLNVVGAGRLS